MLLLSHEKEEKYDANYSKKNPYYWPEINKIIHWPINATLSFQV